METQGIRPVIGPLIRIVSQLSGAWTLVVAWLTLVILAPLLGVPFLGCIAIVIVPGAALMWAIAAVAPVDPGKPWVAQLLGAGALAIACAATFTALLLALGASQAMALAYLRNHAVVPPPELGVAGILVAVSGMGYVGGFRLRWGLSVLVSLAFGTVSAAVVPASCVVFLVYAFVLRLPLSA